MSTKKDEYNKNINNINLKSRLNAYPSALGKNGFNDLTKTHTIAWIFYIA